MKTSTLALEHSETHGNNFDADVYLVPSLAQSTFHRILMDRNLIAIPANRTLIAKDVMLAIALATTMQGMKPKIIQWHFEAARDRGKLKDAYVGHGLAFSYLCTPYVDRATIMLIRCTDQLAIDYGAPDGQLIDLVVYALLPATLCIGENSIDTTGTDNTDPLLRNRRLEVMAINSRLCSRVIGLLTEVDLRHMSDAALTELLTSNL